MALKGEYQEFGWKDDLGMFYHQYLCIPIEALLPDDGTPILDMGCGNGYFANMLIERGYNVYGVDLSEKGIAIANTKNPERFFVNDAESGKLPTELDGVKFKTIISTEVIEHLYNPDSFVKYMGDILRDSGGGKLIISTPYHGYFKNIVLAGIGKMDYHYSALWVGGHIKFWSRKTLSKLLLRCGFIDLRFKGVGRMPYLWRHMIFCCTMPEPTNKSCK